MSTQVEYLGFKAIEGAREYRLRVREAGSDPHDFILIIPNKAFLAQRVRYQDAPLVCFQKLQRELVACSEGMPAAKLNVTDADLEDFRLAHAPKSQQRRSKPTPRP